MKRHLVFYVYPRTAGQTWRRAVEHLLAGNRCEQFDGRKIITIAVDRCCDPASDVQRAFMPWWDSCEFLVRQNDPTLQETAHLIEQLEMLQGEPGIVLRAHAKGSTHPEPEAASHAWLDEMASVCLDYPPLVSCAMTQAHVAGPFRSVMPFGSSSFHFAGSWYWLKLPELFARDWRRIDRWYAGVESYPGTQFRLEESACLFFDGAHTARLYDPMFHEQNIKPALSWWHGRLQDACGMTPLYQSRKDVESCLTV